MTTSSLLTLAHRLGNATLPSQEELDKIKNRFTLPSPLPIRVQEDAEIERLKDELLEHHLQQATVLKSRIDAYFQQHTSLPRDSSNYPLRADLPGHLVRELNRLYNPEGWTIKQDCEHNLHGGNPYLRFRRI